MKMWGLIFLIFAAIACDPYGFGFKKNPAFILGESFKAVGNLDHESFTELSGKEALCLYGNPNGVLYLKENLNFDANDIKLKPYLLNEERFSSPRYVGYWSYYQTRYQVDIINKKSKAIVLKTIIDCHYGTDEKQNIKYAEFKANEYKVKECRLIKIIPIDFSALPLPERCNELRVTL